MLQLHSYNRFPDCVFLTLPNPEANSSPRDFCLSLKFDEQWLPLGQGRVKFGLKGGELTIEGDRDAIQIRDRLSHLHTKIISPDNSTTPIQIWQLDNRENPTWMLSLQSSQPTLQGQLQSLRLATLHPSTTPDNFTASFAVQPHQITLTDAENLWKHDVSPNQHAILERLVVFTLIQHYFAEPLSLVTLSPDPPQPQSVSPDLTPLHHQIEQISQAKNASFLELAALVNLNPKTDFAGGNLRGISGDELDLGGANLALTNLRGAELCDSDLSEANLHSTNLRGADLSGAYLENANLSYSDLQRASLALANLADADLRGANLQGANLSQANLSHAQVEGALFGENVGLTDALKASLEERGARS